MHTEAEFERAVALEERQQVADLARTIDVDPDVFIEAIETGVDHPFWDLPETGIITVLLFWVRCQEAFDAIDRQELGQMGLHYPPLTKIEAREALGSIVDRLAADAAKP